jgi:hypothetical protein
MPGNVWSCYSGTTDEAGTRASYEDVLGRRYSYDQDVANHKRVKIGDVLLIRDDNVVYGFAVVQEVRTGRVVKETPRCPVCNLSRPHRRRTQLPTFRCRNGHEFDTPKIERKEIDAYEAWYEANWVSLSATPPLSALSGLYLDRAQQNAIRPLGRQGTLSFLHDWADMDGIGALRALDDAAPPGPASPPSGGHVPAVGRQRVGQQMFRQRMRERFGDACAVTGPQPPDVLDAAHLYVYAASALHHLDGGLLLRADIHRLFDMFRVTICPDDWTFRVAPDLLGFEWLAALDHTKLKVIAAARPNPLWLREHFDEASRRWSKVK